MRVLRELFAHLLWIQHFVLVEELQSGDEMRVFALQTGRHLSQGGRRRSRGWIWRESVGMRRRRWRKRSRRRNTGGDGRAVMWEGGGGIRERPGHRMRLRGIQMRILRRISIVKSRRRRREMVGR